MWSKLNIFRRMLANSSTMLLSSKVICEAITYLSRVTSKGSFRVECEQGK